MRTLADRLDRPQRCRHVRVMLIGEVVAVDDLRVGRLQDLLQVCNDLRLVVCLDIRAWVVEHHLDAVFAHVGGFLRQGHEQAHQQQRIHIPFAG